MEVDLCDRCDDFMACCAPGEDAKWKECEWEEETHGQDNRPVMSALLMAFRV